MLSRYVSVSLAYCDEGDIDAVKRDGIAAQVWLSATSNDGRWLLAFGAGP